MSQKTQVESNEKEKADPKPKMKSVDIAAIPVDKVVDGAVNPAQVLSDLNSRLSDAENQIPRDEEMINTLREKISQIEDALKRSNKEKSSGNKSDNSSKKEDDSKIANNAAQQSNSNSQLGESGVVLEGGMGVYLGSFFDFGSARAENPNKKDTNKSGKAPGREVKEPTAYTVDTNEQVTEEEQKRKLLSEGNGRF